MCGSFLVGLKICLVTSCHFQASSHFYNESTFNLLGLTSLNFVCWSLIKNILSKYPLKEASLDFRTTKRQRKDMFR